MSTKVRTWQRDERDRFLWLHLRTGMYYVRAKKKGKKPLFKKTGYTQKSKAKTKALILLAEWMGKGKLESVTVGYVCDWVLENYTPRKRIGTQKKHAYYLNDIKTHIGHLDVDSVVPATLADLVRQVKDTPRFSKKGKLLPPRKTFFDYAVHLNLLMHQAYNNRWSTHLVRFESPDPAKKTGRLLTRKEVDALWECMNSDMRDQFVLALECFMRLREALCAPWSEINLETGEWTLSTERVKTGEERSFIVSPNALKRLRERHTFGHLKSPWIFPSPHDRTKPTWSTKTAWIAAKNRAGIKGRCRWHDIRHTALTWALLGDPDATPEQNAKMIRDPMQVSVYAGVSMRTIERVYLKKKAAQTRGVSGAINIHASSGVNGA